jgi:hypothetical protein
MNDTNDNQLIKANILYANTNNISFKELLLVIEKKLKLYCVRNMLVILKCFGTYVLPDH